MAVFGISGLCSSLIGSAVGQSIYNRNRSKLPSFVAACIAFAATPMLTLVLSPGSVFWTIPLAMLGGVAACAGPNLKGMLMNANPSTDRGTVFALFNLIDNMGKGIGPSVLVSITWISGGNRRIAFAVAFSLWFVGAWIANQLSKCLNEDTLAVEIKQQGNHQREPFDLFHLYHS
jgi:predicted MFS family arabinose efflux permease